MAEQGYSSCSRCRPDLAAAEKTYLYGDADTDGALTAEDARVALRCAVRLALCDELQAILADVDSDGRITPADARKILRAAIKLETI